jgi:F-type H+-transporting ATPase subunit b
MDQTLRALAGLAVNAIPTIVLILILHIYLKQMLFKPLQRVLAERDKATAGARKSAEESLRLAEQKTLQYENAIRDARGEVYREQEKSRLELLAEQERRLVEARQKMSEMVADARRSIDAEAAAARQSLADSSGALADQIANSILTGRAL